MCIDFCIAKSIQSTFIKRWRISYIHLAATIDASCRLAVVFIIQHHHLLNFLLLCLQLRRRTPSLSRRFQWLFSALKLWAHLGWRVVSWRSQVLFGNVALSVAHRHQIDVHFRHYWLLSVPRALDWARVLPTILARLQAASRNWLRRPRSLTLMELERSRQSQLLLCNFQHVE